jgi:hypothetical protein
MVAFLDQQGRFVVVTVESEHAMIPVQGGEYWLVSCRCGWRSDGFLDRYEALRAGGRHTVAMREKGG